MPAGEQTILERKVIHACDNFRIERQLIRRQRGGAALCNERITEVRWVLVRQSTGGVVQRFYRLRDAQTAERKLLTQTHVT